MKPDKNLFQAMALYVTKKETKDIEALVQGRRLSPLAPPSWRDLLDGSENLDGSDNSDGSDGQVFENRRKDQDTKRTLAYNNFANGLEKMFRKTPAESGEDALHIGFLFCSLLKLKGTPSSNPKLLELCQRYLTANPEIDPEDGTTFNLYIPKSLVDSFPGGRSMSYQNERYEEQKRKEKPAEDYHKHTMAKTDSARKKLKGLTPIIMDYKNALKAEKLAASNLESKIGGFMSDRVRILFPRKKDKKLRDLIGKDFLTEIQELLQQEDEDKDEVVRLAPKRKRKH